MAKTKKKIASLVLSSVLLAAGGIALANGSSLSASAEEGISPAVDITYYVYTPVDTHKAEYTMVQHIWTGDEDGYMHIGKYEDPSRGYTTIANSGSDCVYKEVRVPSVGSSSTTMEYIWAQSFYEDSNGDIWESDRDMFTDTFSSDKTVTESVVSGTLKTTYKTLESSYVLGQVVYWTVAYKGEVKSNYIDTGASATETWTATLSGVTFTVSVKNNAIQVKSSQTVTCSNTSSSYNGYAAFALHLD